MTQQLIESKWNPVVLGGKSSTYNIKSYAVSSSWYNKVIQNDGTRYNRLKNYHEADTCSVEIGRALDIMAEDITSSNADNEQMFYLDFEDEKKIKKTTMRILGDALDMWEERTEMGMEFFDRVRNTLKYGITFYKKNADGTLTELPSERMVGYVLSEEDENFVTHYIYDPTLERIDRGGRIYKKTNNGMSIVGNGGNTNDKYITYPVDELVIFKIGNTPFGQSVIERVYGVWKTMKLIEDSVVIYRVTRSYERRVYYIDTGNLQGAKREQAIERQRIRLMQKNANRKGEITTEYDPHSMGEDIFIPTNSSGKGSRVETLQGGASLGELTDLNYFTQKLAAGLRVPHSMIDSSDQGQQNQYSDMRVGQMYAVEMRYLGMINRYKKRFQRVLDQNYREFCKAREFVVPDGVNFVINESHSFARYKEMELNQTSLNIFNSTLQINQLSKKLALQKYLEFDTEELRDNEINKLMEKGLDEATINKMSQVEIENIVYGDGRLGEKYGLTSSDGGTGW